MTTVPDFDLRESPAQVLEWKDGDTPICLVDLGYYVRHEVKLRIADPADVAYLNAPETRGEERELGLEALQWARDWYAEVLAIGKARTWPFYVVTVKEEEEKSFDRWLGDLRHRATGRSFLEESLPFVEELRQRFGKPFRYDRRPGAKP